jgi:GT2 family glycosyltransferase
MSNSNQPTVVQMNLRDQQILADLSEFHGKSAHPPPDISVIIVNWNSKDYLRGCLQSLAKHSPTDLTYEVIVVDGASYDGCAEMLAREFPDVRFIQSPDNIGFARANNLGASIATGWSLLLLNPDTELIEDSLSALHSALTNLPNAGAVGCRLLNVDRTLQTSSVLTFPTVFNRIFDSEFLRDLFPRAAVWGMAALYSGKSDPVEVEAISGACILTKRASFVSIGGFSNGYFMYGEDIELCYKFWQAEFKVFHVPTTSIVHFGGGSSRQAASNFSAIMMRESCYRFMQTYRGGMTAVTYRTLMGFSALIRLLLIPPLLFFGNRIVRHGSDSLRKWRAVFLWSIGRAVSNRR